ncbi:hypothetical protein C7450_1241 [Chelatococcus asaccharovorans]|uniref:Uncharacterized protein n=1 Tax=Chelatococcus asaccharovorans TaxID=28210 RepID=A0A2V3TRH8_9HYPH|nr:hypothetical protein C7450_1241 [Chelatococcus asaccharovorans]
MFDDRWQPGELSLVILLFLAAVVVAAYALWSSM